MATQQQPHMPEDAHAMQRDEAHSTDTKTNGNGGGGRAGVEQAVYGPYSSTTYLSPGYPGMISTAEENTIESWPAGAECDFGCAVTKGTSANGTGALVVVNGGAGAVAGIAVHDHIVATYGHYVTGMAVSVMTRGRIWCAVDGVGTGIAEGVPVNFNPATGKVLAAAGTAVPHAVFRGVMTGYYSYVDGTTTNIAEIELHYPMV
jgi:hypothetical protein